ncbi:citrate lyase holo-[acyl-carrier protein] synthase [Orbus sasakiae]|uniref:citrate lyase holo-[acyl-carrier protein] synthase n=1 Tax=Orbus sasakiae TaxID=1078475 RepID=A0ABP9N7M9_9GAMM
MLIDFNDGLPVTLEQVLAAKEQRVERQHLAIKRYQSAIISLTLVMPGQIKKSPITDYLFDQAIKAITHSLAIKHLLILEKQCISLQTGHEAIIVVDCCAYRLKQLCIMLEQQHTLGRLWDIDIIDPVTQNSVSRTQFSYPPRRCLVCGEPAKVCGRLRQHTLVELFAAMANIIQRHQQTNN